MNVKGSTNDVFQIIAVDENVFETSNVWCRNKYLKGMC